jgi:shikimate dehydrogenase
VELALAGTRAITIVNRSRERGQSLADHLNSRTEARAAFVPWTGDFRLPPAASILVNATSIGLYPDVTALPALDYETLRPGMLVCDVIPNPPRTPFLAEAEARGAETLDGLGMLVYQGAIGFQMWTGREAPVAVMHEALSAVFG